MLLNATLLSKLRTDSKMISMSWTAKTITTVQLMNASISIDPSRTCIRVSFSLLFTNDQLNSHKLAQGPWDHRAIQENTCQQWVHHFILWRIRTFFLLRMDWIMNSSFNQPIESQETWVQFRPKSQMISERFHSCVIQKGEKEVDMQRVLEGKMYFRWPDSSTWTRAWYEKINQYISLNVKGEIQAKYKLIRSH